MSMSAAGFAPARIVAAFLRDGNRVLLCHRSARRRWYPDVWDLPGGHVESGELPGRALVRELREELGITVAEPSDPLHDQAFIRSLIATYSVTPRTDWATPNVA